MVLLALPGGGDPMERRDFLTSSLGVAAMATPTLAAAAPSASNVRELYELRRYSLRMGSRQALVDGYMQQALLPTLRRLGLGPIGAFGVVLGSDSPALHVLIPHPNAQSFATLGERLAKDATYRAAAAPYLDASPSEPAYDRYETSLLLAFEGHPRVSVPDAASENRSRIFELRCYESHGEKAALKKIEMFGTGGEIALFRKTGLTPVFFGETLAGQRMPNLVYMLVFDDASAREAAWARFRDHPEWKALAATPGYGNAEIVSTIHSQILRPMPYSQI
jgi:hypothetical protein